MRRASSLLLGLVGYACGSSGPVLELAYPNSDAAAVVRGLDVYEVEAGACAELRGSAAEGRLLGEAERSQFRCAEDDTTACAPDWFESISLRREAEPLAIYLRAFGSVESGAPPLFEGCADVSLAGQSARVEMRHVLPEGAALIAAALEQLAVVEGETGTVVVRLVGSNPFQQGARRAYGIPAFDIDVEAEGPTELASLAPLRTDSEGLLRVELSGAAVGRGAVTFTAEDASVRVGVSVLEAPPALRAVTVDLDEAPVSLSVGDLDEDGAADVAALSCQGPGRCTISERLQVSEELGTSRLDAVLDVFGARVRGPSTSGFGRLPREVEISKGRVAALSARAPSCNPVDCDDDGCVCEDAEGRPCGCEASTLELVSLVSSAWQTDQRYTTSFSSGLFLSVFEERDSERFALAMGGALGQTPECQANCDCAFGQRCDPALGRCEDRVQRVELLGLDDEGDLFDAFDCPEPNQPQTDFCRQSQRSQAVPDGCEARAQRWIPVGPRFARTVPSAFAVGDIAPGAQDLRAFIVGSTGRVDLVAGRSWNYRHEQSLLLNDRVDGVGIANADPRLEQDGDNDLLFWSRTPCADFACPIAGEEGEGEGCFGALLSAGRGPAFTLPTDAAAHCVRRPLPFSPVGGCVGDVDGDGAVDVVWVSADGTWWARGDGFGGFVVPRQAVDPRPALAVACGDADDDDRAEIFVGVSEPPQLLVLEVE